LRLSPQGNNLKLLARLPRIKDPQERLTIIRRMLEGLWEEPQNEEIPAKA
jgi:hypothetical protein